MADLAELAYSVDSSGLVAGTKALDANAAAAEKVSGATERLEKDYQSLARTAQQMGVQVNGAMPADDGRYARIAKEAMAFSESMKGANLSERALAEAAAIAASGIDVQAQAMKNAGTEQERMAARAKVLQEAEARIANQTREASQATERQAINLKQLLGQIDPTIAKLDKLADAEEQLERAAKLGLIKPQQFQQFQAQIDGARAKILSTSQGTDRLGSSMGQLNLRSIETQQSFATLATALASGNFGQVQSSITGLTARTGALSAVFSATGLAVAGFAIATGATMAAIYASDREMDQFTAAILSTGGAAGMTAGQLGKLADTLGGATGRYADAQKAVLALATSGKLTGDSLERTASAAVSLAVLTGDSVESASKQLEELAKAPAKGLLELDERYNFLTASVYEHILALEDQGRATDAVSAATKLAQEEFSRRAELMKEQTRGLTGLVGELRAEWQHFANDLKNIVNPTLDTEIAKKQALLASMQSGGTWYPSNIIPGNRAEDIAVLTEQIRLLQQQKKDQEDLAAGEAYIADLRKQGLDGYVQINQILDRAKTGTDKLEESTRKLEASYKALKLANPQSDLLKGVSFGANGSINGGSYDVAYAQLVKDSQKGQAKPKHNSDDTSAMSLVASIQRQITANEQLAESGDKVTASDRLVIQTQQLLADKTNTMTRAQRDALQAAIPLLQASQAQSIQAVQTQRDLAAQAALTDRLSQIEKQRQDQADLDVMSIGMGTDETQVLQRQLDIQKKYFDEMERLKKQQKGDHPLGADEYANEVAQIEASLGRVMDIERNYQSQRMAALGDWRTGFSTAWKDYAFAAQNYSEQAANFLSNSLGQGEDAFVQFVKTGKASFSSLIDSMIEDLARYAYRQAIVGIFGSITGGGGTTGTVSSLYGSSWGFASGGYTGAGGVNEPAGVVHKGEVVWSQSDIARAGGVGAVEGMRRGMSGYADGGAVAAAVPMAASRSTAGGGNIYVSVKVDGDGNTSSTSNPQGLEQFGKKLGQFVEQKYRELQVRDLSPNGILGRSMR